MKRHRTDRVSLIFGLVFLAIVGIWFADRVVNVVVPEPALLVAGALILFGVLGLLSSLRGGRSRARHEVESPAGPDPDQES